MTALSLVLGQPSKVTVSWVEGTGMGFLFFPVPCGVGPEAFPWQGSQGARKPAATGRIFPQPPANCPNAPRLRINFIPLVKVWVLPCGVFEKCVSL